MTATTLRLVAIVLAGVAVLVFGLTMASAPSRAIERLGPRGRKRMAAIATIPSWAAVEPIVRWLGVRLSRRVPERLARVLDRELVQAGDYLGLLPQEYIAVSLLSGCLAFALGHVVDRPGNSHGLVTVAFTTYGLLAPYLRISHAAETRKLQINRRLPYAVDLLTLGMSAGLDFPGALRHVIAKALPNDPLAEELEYVLQKLQLGQTRRAALLDFAERMPTVAVKEFVQTIVHAEEKGNSLVDVLTIQATVSRQRRTTLAEEAAAKAGVKMIIPMAFIFVALLILILGPILIRVNDSIRDKLASNVVDVSPKQEGC